MNFERTEWEYVLYIRAAGRRFLWALAVEKQWFLAVLKVLDRFWAISEVSAVELDG